MPATASDRTKRRVLEYFTAHPGATYEMAASALGVSKSTAHYAVRALIEDGKLERRHCETCGCPILWHDGRMTVVT